MQNQTGQDIQDRWWADQDDCEAFRRHNELRVELNTTRKELEHGISQRHDTEQVPTQRRF